MTNHADFDKLSKREYQGIQLVISPGNHDPGLEP